jgi:DNA-binding CsgD family transcriptional regulator
MADDVRGVLPSLALFGLIGVFMAADLASDLGEGTGWMHVAVEGVVLLLALAGVALITLRLREARATLARLDAELGAARAAAGRWREENETYLRGLGAAIEAQFERWEATPAEAAVGLLLLKGLSFKEVAAVRGTSERTVREQARSLYRRAGLSSRAALSAYFLEDLLAPSAGADADGEGRARARPE